MEVKTLGARFDHDVLAEVQVIVPLEPGTAARVAEVVKMLWGEKGT